MRRNVLGIGIVFATGVAVVVLILLLGKAAPTSATQSTANKLVVQCVDPRYEAWEHHRLVPHGFHTSCPGCAKCLVEDAVIRESLYHQLALLERLGIHITEVELIDHLTCKVYGDDDSFETHARYLRRAAYLLHQDKRSQHLTVSLKIHDMLQRCLFDVSDE